MPNDPTDIEAVALLDEPARWALYEWVVGAGRAVGRDEAATAVGSSRALAAFHLDRLASAGLPAVEYRRLSGRTGPGAGRPAKLYRRGPREIALSLPERRYEVPAHLFATAMEQMGGPSAENANRALAAGAWVETDTLAAGGSGRGERSHTAATDLFVPVCMPLAIEVTGTERWLDSSTA